MDREVLRLFGLLDGPGETEPEYREAREYVPEMFLNGRKVLRRWTFCVSNVNVLNKTELTWHLEMKLTLMDEMTGRVRFRVYKIKRAWQEVPGRGLHVDTFNRDFPGDWFDLFRPTEKELETERELYLSGATGSIGERAFEIRKLEEENGKDRDKAGLLQDGVGL